MIAHKRFKVIGAVLLTVVLTVGLAVPCFAVSLDDATITYSVKGYFSQYLFVPSWSRGVINSDGSFSSSSAYNLVCDYIECTEGGTVGTFGSAAPYLAIKCIAFYDSSYALVGEVLYFDDLIYLYDVPDGASYFRCVQSKSSTVRVMSSATKYTTSSFQYLFAEFDGITIDGDGIITIPYQTFGYEGIYLDFQFYDSGFKTAQTISFDYYAYFSQHHDIEKVGSAVTFSNDGVSKYAYLNSYYTSNGETVQFISGESSSNLNPYTISCQTGGRYSGFVFTFPVVPASVSTAISIKFSNFAVDGVDTDVNLTLGKASSDLDDLANQLEVPKPTIAVSNIVDDALSGADYQSVGSTTWSFMSNDLITKMLLITVSFALLGYILFGKKESGSK